MNKKILLLLEDLSVENLNLFIKQNSIESLFETNSHGQGLLHLIVLNQNLDNRLVIIQKLCEYGLSPTSVDEQFKTPIDIAKNINDISALTLLNYQKQKHIEKDQNLLDGSN